MTLNKPIYYILAEIVGVYPKNEKDFSYQFSGYSIISVVYNFPFAIAIGTTKNNILFIKGNMYDDSFS